MSILGGRLFLGERQKTTRNIERKQARNGETVVNQYRRTIACTPRKRGFDCFPVRAAQRELASTPEVFYFLSCYARHRGHDIGTQLPVSCSGGLRSHSWLLKPQAGMSRGGVVEFTPHMTLSGRVVIVYHVKYKTLRFI